MHMVICLPKFRITNSVILTSLLKKLELLTKANSKMCLFQLLSSLYQDLAFSLRGRSGPLQIFSWLTTILGALGRRLAI
jgi:hypothetical protein